MSTEKCHRHLGTRKLREGGAVEERDCNLLWIGHPRQMRWPSQSEQEKMRVSQMWILSGQPASEITEGRGLGSSSKEEWRLGFIFQPRDLEGCETMPSLLREIHSLSGPNLQ